MKSRYKSPYGPFLLRDMCVSIDKFGKNCWEWVLRLVSIDNANSSGSKKPHSLELLNFSKGKYNNLDK